jgi:hypothetical protein
MLTATFYYNPNQWSGSIPASSVMVAHRSKSKMHPASFRIVTANIITHYSEKVRERFDSAAERFGVTVALC